MTQWECMPPVRASANPREPRFTNRVNLGLFLNIKLGTISLALSHSWTVQMSSVQCPLNRSNRKPLNREPSGTV